MQSKVAYRGAKHTQEHGTKLNNFAAIVENERSNVVARLMTRKCISYFKMHCN
jgi:hypothetical protein